MPYRTMWEPNGIVWEFYDDVTAQEIEDANDEFYGDPRSDRARYQIIDAANVTSVEWTERDITVAAAYDIGAEHAIKHLRVAYVARNPEIVSKLEKYIEIARKLNKTWQFQGFADVSEARKWVEA